MRRTEKKGCAFAPFFLSVKLACGLYIRLRSGEPGNALAFPCDDDVLPGSKFQVVFQVGFHFFHRDQRVAADVIVGVDFFVHYLVHNLLVQVIFLAPEEFRLVPFLLKEKIRVIVRKKLV